MSLSNTNKYAVLRIVLIVFFVFFTYSEVTAQPSFSTTSIFSKPGIFFNSVAWNPDGQTIAVAGNPSGVVLYNNDFRELFQFENANNATENMIWTPLVWNPDGTRLASIGLDGLYVWSKSGKLLKKLEEGSAIFWTLAWSPDNQVIALGSAHDLTLWDVKTFEKLKTFDADEGVIAIDWEPTGQHLILSIVGKQQPEIWDAKLGTKVALLEWFTQTVGWSPDGTTIATQAQNNKCQGCHSIALWSPDGNLLKTLSAGDISVIKWSPDSKQIATNDLDAKISIWNVASDTHKVIFDDGLAPGVLGAQSSISWSPDGKYLAAASNQGHVLIWGLAPLRLIKELPVEDHISF